MDEQIVEVGLERETKNYFVYAEIPGDEPKAVQALYLTKQVAGSRAPRRLRLTIEESD